MTQSPLATAADYADAMLTARRAKNWLFWLVLVALLAQITIFFLAYSGALDVWQPEVSATTTQPAVAPTPVYPRSHQVSHYLVSLSAFAGLTLVIVLAMVLLLLVLIMLVGRLIGISGVVSALIWCMVLLVLLFPWQAFLTSADVATASFKIPGVLYTWNELVHSQRHWFTQAGMMAVLKWARFVGFPLVAIMILIVVQVKSRRGLKMALGEGKPAEGE